MLLIEPWHICHLATGLLCIYKYVVEEVNKDTVCEARGTKKKKKKSTPQIHPLYMLPNGQPTKPKTREVSTHLSYCKEVEISSCIISL